MALLAECHELKQETRCPCSHRSSGGPAPRADPCSPRKDHSLYEAPFLAALPIQATSCDDGRHPATRCRALIDRLKLVLARTVVTREKRLISRWYAGRDIGMLEWVALKLAALQALVTDLNRPILDHAAHQPHFGVDACALAVGREICLKFLGREKTEWLDLCASGRLTPWLLHGTLGTARAMARDS
jgi:hypothetical protein